MKFSTLAIAATALAAGVEGFSTASAPRAMRQVSEEQLLSRELKKIHTQIRSDISVFLLLHFTVFKWMDMLHRRLRCWE